ncbi:sigma-70 family RNA polymerase sigma factor [Microtetraspora glauca]|uniref:Sigma-70 family RNA polymerase sigma factor n=1 Tax=Microtetraspora glauca TaxID=1996 RepID=A0ABV3G8Q9_MICGL
MPDTVVADDADLVGSRDAVRQAVGCLPPRQRAVIVLRYFADLADLAEDEIAGVLGCSVATVRSQASRALAKLRVDPVARSATNLGSR